MLFNRRRQQLKPDRDALRRVLAEEPPPTAGSVPVTIDFGRSRLFVQIIAAAASMVVLVFVSQAFSLSTNFAILIGVFLLLTNASALAADPTILDVSITVSGEGARMRKLFGERLVQWWERPSVTATPDLVTVVISGGSQRITTILATQTADRRVEFIQALRAWARQYDYDIIEGPPPSHFVRTMASIGLTLGGTAALLAGTFWFTPGNSLGIRCSVNGTYFQERFETPDRQGCTVLRVSAGAEKAGIVQGDLLIELNGIPITSGTQFTIVFDEVSGAKYRVKVIRAGRTIEFEFSGGRRKTFDEDPNDPLYYYLRARGEARDQPNDAIADYSRVIELAPQFDLAYLYRAELFDEIGNYQSASADFLKAVELTPSLGEAYLLLARHERDIERNLSAANFRVRKAIELHECAGAFEEYNVDCNADYYLLGLLQINYYDLQEPIATLEQAVRFWPDTPEPYCVLATLHERADEMETAIEYARAYLDFPEDDRYPNCEADAIRIAKLSRSTAARPSTTPSVTPVSSRTPTGASGIGDCIDFDAASCAP